MKKKFVNIFLSFFIIAVAISAQSKKNRLTLPLGENLYNYKFMDAINESLPGAPALSSRTFYIAIPPNATITVNLINQKNAIYPKDVVAVNPSIKLKNDSLITYQPEQLNAKYFETEIFPKNEVEVVGYSRVDNFYCAYVKVNTQRYNWRLKQIIELQEAEIEYSTTGGTNVVSTGSTHLEKSLKSVILNYDEAVNLNVIKNYTSNDSSGRWIDYTKTYLKILNANDGIYRVTFDDLSKTGIDPRTINPKSFRLFSRGDEKAIYVRGESDLSFDKSDYVEFYAERNYADKDYCTVVQLGKDYKQYLNRYTDSTAIWLTWSGREGKRAQLNSFSDSGIVDTLTSSIEHLHLEQDQRLWYYNPVEPRVQLPFWQENKVWTWMVLGSSGSQAVEFQAKNILPNSFVQSVARFISNASDIQSKAHKVGVSLNSASVQDTISFNYLQTINLVSKYSSANLKEGSNSFRVFGLPTKASFHQSLVDWIDINYYKKNIANNDTLAITVPDSLQPGIRVVKILNVKDVPENLILYKVKPTIKKYENFLLDKVKSELSFADTIRGGDKFILTKAAFIKNAVIKGTKKFNNLRNKSNGADYIIITHGSLIQSANEYQKFISENYGLRTKLIDVNDIYDEFNYGMMSAESIKEFLKYAYSNWIAPNPKYVLIIGDANYDYKDIYTPAPSIRKKNLVPSFGNPVSDVWFTVFDEAAIPSQQMYIGRIPAQNNEQVIAYLNKHKKYLDRPFDEWNKTYLLFSGGDAQKQTELEQIKKVNDNIFQNIISLPPVGGVGKHFYKTITPSTNLGPYTSEEISSSLGKGALIISYVGHSGTQTWDNGITKTDDIQNQYSDRFPVISDFGCSTGKFAEPDVNAFGELFIVQNSNAQAINYLGNTSWGYLSTSTRFPIIFYNELLRNPGVSIGKVHAMAKLKQFQEGGVNDVNSVFFYCNLLFGDPIIQVKLPTKPNYYVDKNSIVGEEQNINDSMDSVDVNVKIKNLGLVPESKVEVSFSDIYNSSVVYKTSAAIASPLFQSEIHFKISVKGKAGIHHIKVWADPKNLIDEINETDNVAETELFVYSNQVKNADADFNYLTNKKNITLINPVQKNNSSEIAEIILSPNNSFSNPTTIKKDLDTLITKINLPAGLPNQRYFWKSRLVQTGSEWSQIYSYQNSTHKYKWYFDNSFSTPDLVLNSTVYDSTSKSIKLSKRLKKLKLISAGSNEGKFASLKINSEETLPNTYFWGVAAAIIDTVTLTPTSFRYFLYPFETSGPVLKKFIDSLKTGTVVALTICDDGAQSALGWSSDTPQRIAIESLGSKYIRDVGYRESWCMIGKKGSAKGTVPEDYKKIYEGQATIEMSKVVTADSGYVVLPLIANSHKWETIYISSVQHEGTKLTITPLASSKETNDIPLKSFEVKDTISSLSWIDSKKYSALKLKFGFKASMNKESPELNAVGIDFKSVPELGINYQVVNIAKDTLEQGEISRLSFSVYNVGESTASNFKVRVDLVRKDNSKEKIFEQAIDSIKSEGKKQFSLTYNTSQITGDGQFQITIDPDNTVAELYEDNNFYSIPFYVQPNNKQASLKLTIDGSDIVNGDFVSSKPNIKIELNDESLIAITDTSKIQIFLNNRREYFANKLNTISYNYSSTNPKMVVNYNPELVDGDYTLKVIGKNATDQIIDSAGVVRKFSIKNELQLINAYNYPNPFKNETYFTFKLTQIPDELRILIFTIAGRKIKEIKFHSSELRYDFNRIHWDGRDADGDLSANGIYFYKIISQKGNEKTEITQKLSIIR